jgi:hypothetical protein
MPFPAPTGKWQISVAGGVQPRWRSDGKELFYLADNAMMAVAVNGTSNAVEVGAVQRLFEVSRRFQNYNSVAVSSGAFGTGLVYDVAADGQRFLVNVVADEQTVLSPITVVTNWMATLR